VIAAALLVSVAALAATDAGLREVRGGVEIDWDAGTLTASGGAAPDLRMPSADVARPGAVRRARAAAQAKLRVALADLPLGGGRKLEPAAVDRALAHADTAQVDYQSNGGAMVRVVARFADWAEAPPEPVATLSVPAMHLAAAPLLKVGGHETAAGAARYRLGAAPASAKALPAHADRSGRLVLDGSTDLAQKLARGVVLIYVHKVLR
jgi:hypothetical protein